MVTTDTLAAFTMTAAAQQGMYTVAETAISLETLPNLAT